MKIYNVIVNKDHEILFPDVEYNDYDISTFRLDFLPKKNKWPSINWYSQYANFKQGNFYAYSFFKTFIFDENVLKSDLYDFIDQCCETLPISYNEKKLYLANVTTCYNVLDRKKTVWQYPNRSYDGPFSKGFILKYEFYRNREFAPIFCIPETYEVYICCDGINSDFKQIYEREGFTGLEFELVAEWD